MMMTMTILIMMKRKMKMTETEYNNADNVTDVDKKFRGRTASKLDRLIWKVLGQTIDV